MDELETQQKASNVVSVSFKKGPEPSPAENTQRNVDYWGDRCCKAEAEVERLSAARDNLVAALLLIRVILMDPKRKHLHAVEDALVPLDAAVNLATGGPHI